VTTFEDHIFFILTRIVHLCYDWSVVRRGQNTPGAESCYYISAPLLPNPAIMSTLSRVRTDHASSLLCPGKSNQVANTQIWFSKCFP